MKLDFSLESWSALATMPASGDKLLPLHLDDFILPDGDEAEKDAYGDLLFLLRGGIVSEEEAEKEFKEIEGVVGFLKFDNDAIPVAFYGPCLQSTESGVLYIRCGNYSFPLSDAALEFSIDSTEKERADGTKYEEMFFVVWDSEADMENKSPVRRDYGLTEAAANDAEFSEIAQEFFNKLPSVKKLNKFLATDATQVAEFVKKQPLDDYSISSGGNTSIKPSELPVGAYEIVEFRRVEWPDKKTKAPRHAFLQQLRGVNSDVWVEGTQRKVVKDATWESYNSQLASGKVSWWLLIKGHREYTGRDGSPKKAAILQMVDSKRGHRAIADLQEGGDMKQVSEITAADVF